MFKRIFLTKFLTQFFYEFFWPIFFDKYFWPIFLPIFWPIFSTNLLMNYFWQILWQIFFLTSFFFCKYVLKNGSNEICSNQIRIRQELPVHLWCGCHSSSQSAPLFLFWKPGSVCDPGKKWAPCSLKKAGCKKPRSLLFKKRRGSLVSSLFD